MEHKSITTTEDNDPTVLHCTIVVSVQKNSLYPPLLEKLIQEKTAWLHDQAFRVMVEGLPTGSHVMVLVS